MSDQAPTPKIKAADSPYAMFGTDKSLESEKGVEMDFGKFQIIVHRAGGENRKYQRVLQATLKPYHRQISAQTLDPETNRKLLVEVYAQSVIVGWKGVPDKDGNLMPFTKENCITLMNELPELFNHIVGFAEDMKNFRAEVIEEAAKN